MGDIVSSMAKRSLSDVGLTSRGMALVMAGRHNRDVQVAVQTDVPEPALIAVEPVVLAQPSACVVHVQDETDIVEAARLAVQLVLLTYHFDRVTQVEKERDVVETALLAVHVVALAQNLNRVVQSENDRDIVEAALLAVQDGSITKLCAIGKVGCQKQSKRTQTQF